MEFLPFSLATMASLICVSFFLDVLRQRPFPFQYLPEMLSTGFGASVLLFLYTNKYAMVEGGVADL